MFDHDPRPGIWKRPQVRLWADGRSPRPTSPCPRRILVVSSELAWIDRVAGLLSTAGMHCICAGTLAVARSKSSSPFDAALIDLHVADGSGLELADDLARSGAAVIISAPHATLDDAAAAAAAGAIDLLARDASARTLIARVMGAVTRRADQSRRARGLDRMDRLGGRDNSPQIHQRRERAGYFDDQLPVTHPGRSAGVPQMWAQGPEHQDPMSQVTIANEFGGLIRHELDIESLLRTTLEFVLAKCGPTNAAVFLPTTSGDFSLGAYVNYDCPKETVDVLLDHLANAVAPRFQDSTGIAHLADSRSLEAAIGDDAGWLDESAVVAFSCRHDDEALAICMLFRDRLTPYPGPLLDQLRTIGELFAAQLARVIRIHHRHLPKNKWGAIGDTDDSDESDGYGGGLAA